MVNKCPKQNFTMKEISSKWHDVQFGKLAKAELKVPWDTLQRFIREKDIFICQGGQSGGDGPSYVVKDTKYVI